MSANEKGFDIYNNSPRAVRCISTKTDVWGGYGGELLTIGRTYNVEKVEVHSVYTEVFIEEIPGKGFNSVLFAEI